MATSNNHKLLVPIDGSDRSVRTAKYLAEMPTFFNMEINLYNVFISIPESYYDLGKEPASVKITSGLYAWEKQQRSQIEKQMQKCRKVLLSSDYNPAKIRTTIQKRRVGVARDIIAESKNGYSAVVSRRRGMSNLQGLIMGSVALKLLNGIDSVPLICDERDDPACMKLFGKMGKNVPLFFFFHKEKTHDLLGAGMKKP